jgi:hypothetical protein
MTANQKKKEQHLKKIINYALLNVTPRVLSFDGTLREGFFFFNNVAVPLLCLNFEYEFYNSTLSDLVLLRSRLLDFGLV